MTTAENIITLNEEDDEQTQTITLNEEDDEQTQTIEEDFFIEEDGNMITNVNGDRNVTVEDGDSDDIVILEDDIALVLGSPSDVQCTRKRRRTTSPLVVSDTVNADDDEVVLVSSTVTPYNNQHVEIVDIDGSFSVTNINEDSIPGSPITLDRISPLFPHYRELVAIFHAIRVMVKGLTIHSSTRIRKNVTNSGSNGGASRQTIDQTVHFTWLFADATMYREVNIMVKKEVKLKNDDAIMTMISQSEYAFLIRFPTPAPSSSATTSVFPQVAFTVEPLCPLSPTLLVAILAHPVLSNSSYWHDLYASQPITKNTSILDVLRGILRVIEREEIKEINGNENEPVLGGVYGEHFNDGSDEVVTIEYLIADLALFHLPVLQASDKILNNLLTKDFLPSDLCVCLGSSGSGQSRNSGKGIGYSGGDNNIFGGFHNNHNAKPKAQYIFEGRDQQLVHEIYARIVGMPIRVSASASAVIKKKGRKSKSTVTTTACLTAGTSASGNMDEMTMLFEQVALWFSSFSVDQSSSLTSPSKSSLKDSGNVKGKSKSKGKNDNSIVIDLLEDDNEIKQSCTKDVPFIDPVILNKMNWLITSPLLSIITAIFRESSKEEIYRSHAYYGELCSITLRIEILMRLWQWQQSHVASNDSVSQNKELGYIYWRIYETQALGLFDDVKGNALNWLNEARDSSVLYCTIASEGNSVDSGKTVGVNAMRDQLSTLRQKYGNLSTSDSVQQQSTNKSIKDSTALMTGSNSNENEDNVDVIDITSGNTNKSNNSSSSSSQLPPLQFPSQRVIYIEGLETCNFFYTNSINNQGYAISRSSSTLEKCSKKWYKELMCIDENLPEEITLFISESHPNYIIVAMTIRNDSCPYYGGTYFFHILIPSDYPQHSPKVHFMTTGSGTVRFNPNLYNCGKVCLSLLGTWSGEPWSPATSNLTQVLTSILYLIFTDQPYFNEPGYASMRGTLQGDRQSGIYDFGLMINSLDHAIAGHFKMNQWKNFVPEIQSLLLEYYEKNWDHVLYPELFKKFSKWTLPEDNKNYGGGYGYPFLGGGGSSSNMANYNSATLLGRLTTTHKTVMDGLQQAKKQVSKK